MSKVAPGARFHILQLANEDLPGTNGGSSQQFFLWKQRSDKAQSARRGENEKARGKFHFMYPHIMLRGTSPKACESLIDRRHRLVACGGVLAGWKATDVVRGRQENSVYFNFLYIWGCLSILCATHSRGKPEHHIPAPPRSQQFCATILRTRKAERTGGEVSRRARMDCLLWSLLMA